MIIISWNIRGLNSKGKQRHLQDRIVKEKPHIILLQETKLSGERLTQIVERLKPHYEVMAIDANGTAGGTAILWNPSELEATG